MKGPQDDPLTVCRWRIGLELNNFLLFRTHQPTFAAWVLCGVIGGILLARHEAILLAAHSQLMRSHQTLNHTRGNL